MNSRRLRAWVAAVAASLVVLVTGIAPAAAAFNNTTGNSGNTFAAGTGFDTGAFYTWGETLQPQLFPAQVGTATTWSSASVGAHYGCGVQSDGSLWCWGSDNANGKQGTGDTAVHYAPVRVGSSTWTQVAAGDQHACAVRSDQTLWCWGDGSNGKLGLGTTTGYTTPQQVTSPAATGWASVATGQQFTCATRTDGTLYCFGLNTIGQTGIGNTTSPQSTPAQVTTPSTTGWATVALGYQHACALRTDQTLYCWGDGGSGRLGQNSTAAFSSPQPVAGAWTKVSLGVDFSCAVKSGGTLWCWGLNNNGQLGSGNTTNYLVPNQVGSATTWRSVHAGNVHTCAQQTGNTEWCWGSNTYGQLGQNDTTTRSTPIQVGTVTTWSVPATGFIANQTCSIRSTGTLWCWGDTSSVRFTPLQEGTDTTWRSVAAGYQFFCGVKAAGTLWCWGTGGSGQIGNGASVNAWTATQVGSGTTWAQVAAGYSSACATTTDGKLWCWGNNTNGQLGNGGTTTSNTPVQVTTPAATGWARVSLGSRVACATRTDATLYCFGQNNMGQAGVGNTTDPQATPVQVTTPAATGWAAVSPGFQHVCALRTDRTLYCWGDGGGGRLGVGSNISYSSPQQVPGSSWWVLGTGTDHTCAIKLTGTLWCWGVGSQGRLGTGGTTDSYSPAQVGTAATWRSVTGGNSHTCAVRADNNLWCWGNNDKGQLGLGSAVSSVTVPNQVTGYTGRPPLASPGANNGVSGLITY